MYYHSHAEATTQSEQRSAPSPLCTIEPYGPSAQVHEAAKRSLLPPRSPPSSTAGEEELSSASPPPHFRVGTRVSHLDATGLARAGSVVGVHAHAGSEPYYSVALDGGGERSTEGSHLALLSPGWPSLRACVACVLANTLLSPPPAHVAGEVLSEQQAADLQVAADLSLLLKCNARLHYPVYLAMARLSPAPLKLTFGAPAPHLRKLALSHLAPIRKLPRACLSPPSFRLLALRPLSGSLRRLFPSSRW